MNFGPLNCSNHRNLHLSVVPILLQISFSNLDGWTLNSCSAFFFISGQKIKHKTRISPFKTTGQPFLLLNLEYNIKIRVCYQCLYKLMIILQIIQFFEIIQQILKPKYNSMIKPNGCWAISFTALLQIFLFLLVPFTFMPLFRSCSW